MYEGTCIEKIDGDTKIIKLLTTGYGNDWLCLTVDIIVSSFSISCVSYVCVCVCVCVTRNDQHCSSVFILIHWGIYSVVLEKGRKPLDQLHISGDH